MVQSQENAPNPKFWSIPSKSVNSTLLYYVLVCCALYLKLEGVTIEKSDRAALTMNLQVEGRL